MLLNRFLNESPLSRIKHFFNNFFLYRRIRKRCIYKIPSHLSSLSQALNTVATDTEPHFLQIGEALQAIYTETNELTQKIMHMIKQIGGDSDESVIAKVANLAKGSLSALQNHQSEIPINLQHITRIIESLEKLLRLCGWFERFSAFLRVVAVNIGVESSRFVKSRELFFVVAQETKRLAENVKEITEKLDNDVASTQSSQISAHHAISQGLNDLNDLAGDAEKALNTAVKEIEQIMKLAVKTLEQAQLQSQEISRQVDEIVAGIQLHDSMRQRIEHIIRSFTDIDRLYKEYESDRRYKDTDNSGLGSIHSIMAVQSAQLKQIIADVDTVYKNNVGAFEIIGKTVDLLVENVSGERDQGIGSSPMEESFRTLRVALQNLNQLLHQGQDLVKPMRYTAKRASKTAGKLSLHMDKIHEISFEMRIKALNAIIKAAHLEEGKTQEVLAQAMNEHSNQSSSFAANVIETLQAITESAQSLIDRTQENQQLDRMDYGIGKGYLDDGIQEISHTFDGIKDHSSETFDQVDALKRSISQTQKDHQFMKALSAQLTSFHMGLEQMANQLSPWEMKDQDGAVTWMSEVARNYTMEKERFVHGRFAQDNPLSHDGERMVRNASTDEAAEVLEDDEESTPQMNDEEKNEEDFGDNVELF